MIFKPNEYALHFYGGVVTAATIRNWCKAGKLPKGHTVEMTPTGKYLIRVNEAPKSKAEELFKMMERKVA